MRICRKGLLDQLVKPVSEGGTGYCEWIVGQMASGILTSQQILDASVNSGLETINWVDIEYVKKVMEYMIGKTFSGVTIGKFEDEVITYSPQE